jgi:hypothetical protein
MSNLQNVGNFSKYPLCAQGKRKHALPGLACTISFDMGVMSAEAKNLEYFK